EAARGGERFGDVVADEDRNQDEVRADRPDVAGEDGAVLARPGAGDAEVAHLRPGQLPLQAREVVVRERDRGADREGIAQGRDANGARGLDGADVGARVAPRVAAQAAAVVLSRA